MLPQTTMTPATPPQPAGQPVALVTGGAVRVGRAICLSLARAGFDVALSYRSSAAPASSLVREIETLGRRARAFAVDLRDREAPAALIAAAHAALGRLDVLVCSAASFDAAALADVTADGFARQMAINAQAPLLLAQAAAPHLAHSGRGRIINILDLSAERPLPGRLVHGMTKAALLSLTQSLALELAPEVQVHAVVPGTVLPPPSWSPGAIEALVAPTPARRVGAGEDVGEAVVHLATCTPFATGGVLHVDGGAHLLGPPG